MKEIGQLQYQTKDVRLMCSKLKGIYWIRFLLTKLHSLGGPRFSELIFESSCSMILTTRKEKEEFHHI